MTCGVQASLAVLGFIGSSCYNCSICLYYLVIITTFNKKDDYIRRKLELWFHSISILAPLVLCTIMLVTHSFNGPTGGICFLNPYIPPHCIGYEVGEIPRGYNIPCGRGGEDDGHVKLRTFTILVGNVTILGIAPAIMTVSMITMYRSVAKIEKQIQNYGVGALRLRASLAAQNQPQF